MPDAARQVGDVLDPALDAALVRLDTLVESFEQDPDPSLQDRVAALLQAVDAVHRTGLTRLAGILAESDGTTHGRVLADPAVRVLLELYDLLPEEQAPPAGFIPLANVKIKRGART